MPPDKITVNWLKKRKFFKQPINQPTIRDVILKELKSFLDGRGDVVELWSLPWVKSEGFVVPRHCYQSATDFGVVKCWHLHAVHTDQFAVTRGKIQICLVDLRAKSSTFGHVNVIFSGIEKPRLLKIPPGVLHGWKCLSFPEVIVHNYQSHVYDPKDEFKFPWNCILEDIWEPRNGWQNFNFWFN